MTSSRIPVADGLFTWPSDEPRLIGSRCEVCRVVTFPTVNACPHCTSEEIADEFLEPRGTLWTWTIQGFPPKSPPYAIAGDPDAFEPYAVGYVELPGQVLVESRLTVAEPASLRIGMEMELTIEPFLQDDDGNEVVTFAFRPAVVEES